ncbi:MAG: hypothetical protein K2P84_05300, partial [Undibacterium sp.]|nr:hypothetical protein [Undibacterium sp.]
MTMFASFSNRMTGYFAALFIAALGLLFVLWYFGFAWLGLVGANSQGVDHAIHPLEVRADLQRQVI